MLYTVVHNRKMSCFLQLLFFVEKNGVFNVFFQFLFVCRFCKMILRKRVITSTTRLPLECTDGSRILAYAMRMTKMKTDFLPDALTSRKGLRLHPVFLTQWTRSPRQGDYLRSLNASKTNQRE